MHTNLDMAENGINDYLVKLLGLKDIEYLKIVKEELPLDLNEYGLGRIGFLGEKISFKGFIDIIRDRFSLTQLRYVGDKSDYLSCVALCSGSGADLIETAAQKGADVLLTADIKYHQAQYAEQLGLNLVDAGHYQTEYYVKTILYDYFVSKLEGVSIFKSELNTDPWKYD